MEISFEGINLFILTRVNQRKKIPIGILITRYYIDVQKGQMYSIRGIKDEPLINLLQPKKKENE